MDLEESDNEETQEQERELQRNARVRFTDMTPAQYVKAVKFASESFAKTKMDKDAASYLKAKLDSEADFSGGSDGAWQVIVGRSFGISLAYETKYMLFFDLLKQRRTILAFKTQ